MTDLMRAIAALAVLVLLAAPARADYAYPPLQTLPPALLHELGPLLHGSELALIESDAQGGLRQITTMTLVAAAPEAVRAVVMHPERYAEFVRNMPRSTVEARPDGTLDHHYRLAYSIITSDGANRYQTQPPIPGDESEPAPLRIFDITGTTHYRWEFHRPASGGGTLLVVYGYTDLRHSGSFYQTMLHHAQTLEHGMALVIQMALMLAMKHRAEQQPGAFPPYASPPPGTRLQSYEPLLQRGLVALLRSQGGRLADLSLVETRRATPQRFLQTAAQVSEWSRFVPTISKSMPSAPADSAQRSGAPSIDVEQTLPLLAFRTSFGVQQGAAAVDLYGMAGDLRGARLRFDVRGKEVVLRSMMHYDRSSMVLRQLYKLEPLFEYGVNVGLGLTILRGVHQQAERL